MAAFTVGRMIRAADRHVRPRSGMVGLIYHRVGARSPSPVDLPTDVFRQHMEQLAQSNNAVTFDEGLATRGGVTVTFDDGTRDWLEVVLPVLEEFSIPALFYVATKFIDEQERFPDDGEPLSWSALTELASHPLVTIGGHTHSHFVLSSADAATAESELQRSNELLAEHTGEACRHFAYPKAVLGSAPAEVVVRRLYESATLAGGGANNRGDDPYRLRRTPLTVRDSAKDFTAKLRGAGRLEGALRERRDARRARRRHVSAY